MEDEERPAENNVCLGRGTILFVEDDPEQRQSVPRIIEKLGYLVTAADSASQALELILIIDDDDNFCGTMKSLVLRMEHDFLAAGTLEQGIRILGEQAVDILLLDVGLPDGNGLEALPRIKEASKSSPEIFIITGLGHPAGAETAITEGVWDYIVKPTAIKETRASLCRALKYRQEKQNRQQTVTLDLDRIVGRSVPMQKCFEVLAQGAGSSEPVLITGETGTGKELFAQTIHANSLRKNKGFIVVDCAFLTETLMESSLFGHRKGSFTGAVERRDGLVKLADQGTLFLDKVGEIPCPPRNPSCASSRQNGFVPWAIPMRSSEIFASLPPPTGIWMPWWKTVPFAGTCSTAFAPSISLCHLCAAGARTLRR